MRPDRPTGTVTFVFTEGEGSTSLLNELGEEAITHASTSGDRSLLGLVTEITLT